MAFSDTSSLFTDYSGSISTHGQRVGKPRLDRATRLLHRFYEPLVLLQVLDPTRGEQNAHLFQDSESDTSQDLRRKFLDRLSWMCDYKQGGETVSAIAAQANPEGTIFWLAANNDCTAKALPHLRWILERLEQSFNASDEALEDLENEITAKCIEFSRDKVKNYSRQLRNCVEILAAQPDQQDLRLLEYLRMLCALRDNHIEMCSLAYSFRGLGLLETLSQRHERSGPTGPSLWSRSRHYVGRLGSWSRASKTLLRATKTIPNLVTSFQIECLSPPPPISAPCPDEKTNLDSALGRMHGRDEIQRLEEAREVVRNTNSLDISAEFFDKYCDKKFKPRVHAEVLLLEHFYHQKLDFLDNDRYIGCSKPSCYCCDIYMKIHPGGFVQRPCHGNLWINWRAPVPPIKDDKAAQKHTANMLNEMIKYIRRDALNQLLSKRPRRPRVPDSTTGMSTSIREPGVGFPAILNPRTNRLGDGLLSIANQQSLLDRDPDIVSPIEPLHHPVNPGRGSVDDDTYQKLLENLAISSK